MMRFIAIFCAGLTLANPTMAQDRETLGVGRLFNNDFFGDNDDRWRTGSYAVSIVRGPKWQGVRPTAPGAVLEYRLRSEIITPSELGGSDGNDRAYVGALSAGVHTHFEGGGANISAGVDLVVTGSQTGLDDLQDNFHDLISAPSVSESVRDSQVGNDIYPTALAELSYPVAMNTRTTFRPFVEAQYGVEDFVRVGVDVLIGGVLQGDLLLRDSPSGQLYSGVDSGNTGLGFVVGADYAYVDDSEYFPSSFGTDVKDDRFRARAGVHLRFDENMSYFYGITYLGEEFSGQDGGQFIGSLKLSFNF